VLKKAGVTVGDYPISWKRRFRHDSLV